MITPVFSAAHISRMESVSDNRHPRRKRTRISDGEEQTETEVEVDHEPPPARASRKVKPLPAHVHGHRQQSGELLAGPTQTSTKESSHDSTRMAVKTHTWVTLWFVLSAPVIFWDVGYCFMRPRSMLGGDLHWIWKPYEIYQNIDFVYGTKALEENNGFTNAQSFLNIVETLMNLAYVYLAHVSGWSPAPLIGFAAVTMTLSKTILYWAQEYYCGFCAIGHNTMSDLIVYWIIPNGIWIVIPSLIVLRLGKDIATSLHVAERAATKTASGKQK
ncbi:hypothetical protein BDR07DRAFT_1393243 [Suillus spraguei]|nr:hypothetical protein BDR07DRAFT_1419799 [Suillus spraguei]KAG2367651.1 hypothetical protein BDR07DRAFT_1393243 [Suillus spraguei]